MRHVTLGLACLLILAGSACTLGRDYVGTSLRADPLEVLTPGATHISAVLELFGAPNRIQRRRNGEVFVYHFVRQNQSELELKEPIVTGLKLFTYQKRQIKADRLTLFFDDDGLLTHFGYTSGVEELQAL